MSHRQLGKLLDVYTDIDTKGRINSRRHGEGGGKQKAIEPQMTRGSSLNARHSLGQTRTQYITATHSNLLDLTLMKTNETKQKK